MKLPSSVIVAGINTLGTMAQGLIMKKDKRTGIKKVDPETVVQNGGNAAVLYLGVELLDTNEKAGYLLIGIGGLSLLISQLQFVLTKPKQETL